MFDSSGAIAGLFGPTDLIVTANQVLYPCSLLPLRLNTAPEHERLRTCYEQDQPLCVVPVRTVVGSQAITESGTYAACLARVVSISFGEDNETPSALLCGIERAYADNMRVIDSRRVVDTHPVYSPPADQGEALPLQAALTRIVNQLPPSLLVRPKLAHALKKLEPPLETLTDLVADGLHLRWETKHRLMSTTCAVTRARYLMAAIENEQLMVRSALGRTHSPVLCGN